MFPDQPGYHGRQVPDCRPFLAGGPLPVLDSTYHLIVPKQKTSRPGARGLTFAVPPFFGLFGHLFSGTVNLAIPWALITLPLRQSLLSVNFSVCGSQVHSNLAQVSAHTFPDSLNSASGCTSPVLSLCPYSIAYNINPAYWFVKRDSNEAGLPDSRSQNRGSVETTKNLCVSLQSSQLTSVEITPSSLSNG